jgi:hypothetical protein
MLASWWQRVGHDVNLHTCFQCFGVFMSSERMQGAQSAAFAVNDGADGMVSDM